MKDFGRWVSITKQVDVLQEEPYGRHWISFSSETEEGDRALKDPLSLLKGRFPDIDESWQVITMVVNAQRPFGPYGHIHWCQEWMIVPDMKFALGVTFKHAVTDQPIASGFR